MTTPVFDKILASGYEPLIIDLAVGVLRALGKLAANEQLTDEERRALLARSESVRDDFHSALDGADLLEP